MRPHQANIRSLDWYCRRDQSGGSSCILAVLLALFFFTPSLSGQYSVKNSLLKDRNVPGQYFHPVFSDSIAHDTTSGMREGRSALTAILLSAVLPGAGQIYAERYWSVPIVVGFTVYFIRQWVKADDLYISARDRYRQSVEQGVGGGQGDGQFLYERDFYRDQRDKFAFYLALTYILNIADAYVGASLYNFEVDDDLNGIEMKLRIPIQ